MCVCRVVGGGNGMVEGSMTLAERSEGEKTQGLSYRLYLACVSALRHRYLSPDRLSAPWEQRLAHCYL